MRSVPYVNLRAQSADDRQVILDILDDILADSQFIDGAAVAAFEQAMTVYLGIKHVVAVDSGTDALIIALRALGIGRGDEVITPPNSFIASTSAIVEVGATPVFADIRDDGNIDPDAVAAAITPNTAAIMPVHLTGRVADMAALGRIAENHGIAIVEDAAQSIGSRYDGRLGGTFGTVGCFSAHPLKNVNAAGDAGFLATNDDRIAEFARLYRNIGMANRDTVVMWGRVSRMDTLQAAILGHRLKGLPAVIERRRANAERYRRKITAPQVQMPVCRDIEFNTFHVFVVQAEGRDGLAEYLQSHGIATAVHYPIPIHLQPVCGPFGCKEGDYPLCEAQAKRILSLPIHQYLSNDDIDYVADRINTFYGSK
jgi:dTDP-4-amino-4,6-dideoxygalactose transaminase